VKLFFKDGSSDVKKIFVESKETTEIKEFIGLEIIGFLFN